MKSEPAAISRNASIIARTFAVRKKATKIPIPNEISPICIDVIFSHEFGGSLFLMAISSVKAKVFAVHYMICEISAFVSDFQIIL